MRATRTAGGTLTRHNLYDPGGRTYSNTGPLDGSDLDPRMVRVRTYGDVLYDFRAHPEVKAAGGDERPCDRLTAGWLSRRSVRKRRGSKDQLSRLTAPLHCCVRSHRGG